MLKSEIIANIHQTIIYKSKASNLIFHLQNLIKTNNSKINLQEKTVLETSIADLAKLVDDYKKEDFTILNIKTNELIQLANKLNLPPQKNNYNSLSQFDIEALVDLFFKKITLSLKKNNKIELRGFGTISKKINKAKNVRNPKTNEIIKKDDTYKLHFKIGKIFHQKINNHLIDNE